jgi:UDP-N-acetylmuramoyl-L-alanyl-D-glutamate--2,6-diaminopimelate ligase
METIVQANAPYVVVDFAHTPDALEKVLKALRPFCKHKLWCVFGCGGQRDEGKRPMMAQVAERYADQVVLTADNPRGESMDRIIEQTCKGFTSMETVHVDKDRASAIRLAITLAQSDDMILIAGKGHEAYQDICGKRYVYSDQLVVHEALQTLNKRK